MMRWSIGFLFLCVPLFAQQDIKVSSSGPFYSLVSGASPGISGGGGLNNNYIVTPSSNTLGFCMQVTNRHASQTATVLLGVFQTADPAVSAFNGISTQSWILGATIPIIQSGLGSGMFYIPVSGGSRYTFQFSGSSTNGGPVDIAMVQTNACNAGVFGGVSPSGVPFLCSSFTGGVTVASGTTTKIASIGISNTSSRVHVCGYSVSLGGAVTAAKNLFVGGTGATCGTGTLTVWALQSGTTTSQIFEKQASNGQVFDSGLGDDLCYTDAGTTTGSIVNISYAVF